MVECMSGLCVMGIVAVALLLLTGAISLEQAGQSLARGIALLIAVTWAVCILKALMVAILPAIKTLLTWVAITVAVLAGVVLLVAVLRVTGSTANKTKDNGGEP